MAKNAKRLELIHELEKELKYARFIHTMGVAFTATSLAARYDYDIDRAETAGLLHDCAKYLPIERMNAVCNKAGLTVSEMEKNSVSLLHSKAGSVLARTKYGVTDPEILDAIRYHTTGRHGMTLLDKIIFIADYSEPGRDAAPNLPEIRELAFQDLDACLMKILEDTLRYLEKSGKEIDLMTRKTYNYYKKQYKEVR